MFTDAIPNSEDFDLSFKVFQKRPAAAKLQLRRIKPAVDRKNFRCVFE
jgi:hypothetical protein